MSIGENYYYGGLLRFDLSPKPAYYKIKELTQQRWHTEATLATDENGNADFRGFFGTYLAELVVNGQKTIKEIKLSKKGDQHFEIVL